MLVCGNTQHLIFCIFSWFSLCLFDQSLGYEQIAHDLSLLFLWNEKECGFLYEIIRKSVPVDIDSWFHCISSILSPSITLDIQLSIHFHSVSQMFTCPSQQIVNTLREKKYILSTSLSPAPNMVGTQCHFIEWTSKEVQLSSLHIK